MELRGGLGWIVFVHAITASIPHRRLWDGLVPMVLALLLISGTCIGILINSSSIQRLKSLKREEIEIMDG